MNETTTTVSSIFSLERVLGFQNFIFSLATFFSALVPGPSQEVETLLTVVFTLLALSLAITAVTLLVYVVVALLATRRANSGSFDLKGTVERLLAYLATLAWPILFFYGYLRSLLATTAAFLAANARFIAVAIVATMAAWLWTVYYGELLAATGTVYTVLVDVYRGVLLYIPLLARIVFDIVYPWINLFVVRIPSAIVTGFFFDVSACGEQTWSALAIASQRVGEEFIVGFEGWFALGALNRPCVPGHQGRASGDWPSRTMMTRE